MELIEKFAVVDEKGNENFLCIYGKVITKKFMQEGEIKRIGSHNCELDDGTYVEIFDEEKSIYRDLEDNKYYRK